MHFLKLVQLFTKNNFLQLRRKWRTLPLLLLFPILLIGLVSFVIVSYFSSLEEEPLNIGLVDLDQSTETELVVGLLEQSSQLGDFVHMIRMSEEEAILEINEDELSAYILFPDEFTEKLYNGQSVVLTVVGNPNRQLESYFIKEIVDSTARHISVSQANILTINYFAKQLELDSETRNELLLEQFKDFLLYAIGKDNVLDQKLLNNNATSTPTEYYGIAAGFFVLTIWLFAIYNLLYREQSAQIKTRMTLYGVTELQQIIARILVTLVITTFLGSLLFFGIGNFLNLDINPDGYIKMIILLVLYTIIFLSVLAIIELILPSQKVRLLIQIILTGITLLASGSLVPDIYFPIYIQNYIDPYFAFQTFFWLEEILLNDRLFVDYIPLLITSIVSIFILIGISFWKERVQT